MYITQKIKELVVIHDDTIDRTSNGKGKVSDFTFKKLKALDFGFYKGEKFKGRVYRLLMKC